MNQLAKLLLDLLCHVSTEPEAGHNEDDIDDIKIDTWQTLIHELPDSEMEIFTQAVKLKLEDLKKTTTLSFEQQDFVVILESFLDGSLT